MGAGLGLVNAMKKTLKENRELLRNAKASFDRRKKIKLAKNQDFVFNKLPPKEFEAFKAALEEKALKRKKQEKIGLVVLLGAVLLASSFFWLSEDIETSQPVYRTIQVEDQKAILTLADNLGNSLRTGDYQTFRNSWNGIIPFEVSIAQSSLHLFVREQEALIDLSEVKYFECFAEAEISIFDSDSLLTARYRIEMIRDRPLITDFALGDWPEEK